MYLHGGVGYLQFADENDKLYSYNVNGSNTIMSKLSELHMNGMVYDFSCSAAARINSEDSVADALMKKVNTGVLACDVGVSFSYDLKLIVIENWYARIKKGYSPFNPHWYYYHRTNNSVVREPVNWPDNVFYKVPAR